MLFVSTPLLTVTFGREWGGQRKAFLSGAVVEQGPWDRRKQSPFAGRRGLLFQDPAGQVQQCPAGHAGVWKGLKRQVVPMVPTMAAGRAAPGQAQSDLGLGGLGILGRRTGLGGAHWEAQEGSTARLSLLSKPEAWVGSGADGLGSLEKSTCQI